MRKLTKAFKTKSLSERFASKWVPEPNSGCWLWNSTVNTDGYPILCSPRQQLRKPERIRAHRAAWIIYKGEIPQGMQVCHKCDTPLCVNPDHLFVGTSRDNNRDRQAKGRGADVKGIKSPVAKLSEADVLSIRKDCRSQSVISREFGITQATVSKIKLRQRWSHL